MKSNQQILISLNVVQSSISDSYTTSNVHVLCIVLCIDLSLKKKDWKYLIESFRSNQYSKNCVGEQRRMESEIDSGYDELSVDCSWREVFIQKLFAHRFYIRNWHPPTWYTPQMDVTLNGSLDNMSHWSTIRRFDLNNNAVESPNIICFDAATAFDSSNDSFSSIESNIHSPLVDYVLVVDDSMLSTHVSQAIGHTDNIESPNIVCCDPTTIEESNDDVTTDQSAANTVEIDQLLDLTNENVNISIDKDTLAFLRRIVREEDLRSKMAKRLNRMARKLLPKKKYKPKNPIRQCPYCSKEYKAERLRIHVNAKHTQKYRYQCSKCKKSYKYRDSFYSHRKKKHAGEVFSVTRIEWVH